MKKIKKNLLKENNFNLPLEDYNFLYDFDDKFFEEDYPYMWRNVALYVENNYAKEYKRKVKELENEIFIKLKLADYQDKKLVSDLNYYLNARLFEKKLDKAKDLMRNQMKKYKLELNPGAYITTKKEREELNKIQVKRANDYYITRIKGNGLDIVIDRRKYLTIFKYKDGEKYDIDTRMDNYYRRDLYPREIEIIKNCAEAGLFYKHIGRIFNWNEKFIGRVLKDLGITNVFLTPQKELKNLSKIRVLDPTEYFVIEVDNKLYNKTLKNG